MLKTNFIGSVQIRVPGGHIGLLPLLFILSASTVPSIVIIGVTVSGAQPGQASLITLVVRITLNAALGFALATAIYNAAALALWRDRTASRVSRVRRAWYGIIVAGCLFFERAILSSGSDVAP